MKTFSKWLFLSYVYTFDTAIFFHFNSAVSYLEWDEGKKIFISIFKSPTFRRLKKAFYKESHQIISISRGLTTGSILLYFSSWMFFEQWRKKGSNLLSSATESLCSSILFFGRKKYHISFRAMHIFKDNVSLGLYRVVQEINSLSH